MDPVTKAKVDRFRAHFPQFEMLLAAGDLAQVVTIDQLSQRVSPLPKGDMKEEGMVKKNMGRKLVLAISHTPLITPIQK